MLPSIRLTAAQRALTLPRRQVSVPSHPVPRQPQLTYPPMQLPLRRSYAAAPAKSAKPPITIHSLEGTYASALYSATGANNATLAEIEKALSSIRTRLDNDVKLAAAVVNPAVSHKEKQDIVQLLTTIGRVSGDAQKAVKNLLEVMSENGRLGRWDGVVAAFEKIMRAHKGEVDVVVTSAQVCKSPPHHPPLPQLWPYDFPFQDDFAILLSLSCAGSLADR